MFNVKETWFGNWFYNAMIFTQVSPLSHISRSLVTF